MALFIGFVAVSILGVAHHFGLLVVRIAMPDAEKFPNASVAIAFVGLLALHSLEIISFAAAYSGLMAWGALGTIGNDPVEDWQALVYFSGINFITLGYTEIQTEGPIRLVSMMQSLGGFMVLTWSATFLYSVSERAWKR